MVDVHFTKVVSGRRITLPVEVCAAMRLKIGDNVRLEVAGNDLLGKPMESKILLVAKAK